MYIENVWRVLYVYEKRINIMEKKEKLRKSRNEKSPAEYQIPTIYPISNKFIYRAFCIQKKIHFSCSLSVAVYNTYNSGHICFYIFIGKGP